MADPQICGNMDADEISGSAVMKDYETHLLMFKTTQNIHKQFGIGALPSLSMHLDSCARLRLDLRDWREGAPAGTKIQIKGDLGGLVN